MKVFIFISFIDISNPQICSITLLLHKKLTVSLKFNNFIDSRELETLRFSYCVNLVLIMINSISEKKKQQ